MCLFCFHVLFLKISNAIWDGRWAGNFKSVSETRTNSVILTVLHIPIGLVFLYPIQTFIYNLYFEWIYLPSYQFLRFLSQVFLALVGWAFLLTVPTPVRSLAVEIIFKKKKDQGFKKNANHSLYRKVSWCVSISLKKEGINIKEKNSIS